jgi:hypothetical protein
MAKAQHVMRQGGGWIVKTEGDSEGSSFETIYRLKRDAIDAARDKARHDGSDLVIHGRNGQAIQHPIEEATIISEDIVRVAVRELSKNRSQRFFKRIQELKERARKLGLLNRQGVQIESPLAKSVSTRSMKTKSGTNASAARKSDEI